MLLDRRLYRMKRVYWSAKRIAPAPAGKRDLETARVACQAVVEGWNDNLNRLLALVQTHFGKPMRERLQLELYNTYAAVGEELDCFVREVSVAERGPVRVRPIGRRLNDLGHRVFAFNLLMLAALEREQVGRKCGDTAAVPWDPLPIRFGVDGPIIGRVQVALRTQGSTNLVVDSHFGQGTDDALRGFQRRHDLTPDGVAGPRTLNALGLTDGGPR